MARARWPSRCRAVAISNNASAAPARGVSHGPAAWAVAVKSAVTTAVSRKLLARFASIALATANWSARASSRAIARATRKGASGLSAPADR